MSLKLGNTNIAGTQILYSTTGNNTDGAMTQAATTTELNNCVHKTGNETISGVKTFASGVVRFYRLNSTNQHIEFIYNGQDPNQGNYPGAYIPIETLGIGWKRIFTENDFQVVSTLPANPDNNIYYCIPE